MFAFQHQDYEFKDEQRLNSEWPQVTHYCNWLNKKTNFFSICVKLLLFLLPGFAVIASSARCKYKQDRHVMDGNGPLILIQLDVWRPFSPIRHVAFIAPESSHSYIHDWWALYFYIIVVYWSCTNQESLWKWRENVINCTHNRVWVLIDHFIPRPFLCFST